MKSHTVPQRLLKQFAYHDTITDSLRLWRYVKGKSPTLGVSPKSATRVDGYFANSSDAGLESRVEQQLASEIEDPVHKFLPNFSDEQWLMSNTQRKQMTRYITLLFNRCLARREATKHTQELIAHAFKCFIENESQCLTVAAHWNIQALSKGIRLERLIRREDVVAAAKNMLVRVQTDGARQDSFVNNIVNAMAMFDETMFSGSWNVLRTPNSDPFFLSDTPVVTWQRIDTDRLNYGLGFEKPDVEVLLPISPLTCLHIAPRVRRSRPPQIPTVREINVGQAAFSMRACFADQYKKDLDEIVQTSAYTVHFGRNAFTLWHRKVDEMLYDILMQQQ